MRTLIPCSSQAASHRFIIWRWYVECKRTPLYPESVSFPVGIVLEKSIQQNSMYWCLEHAAIEAFRGVHFPSAQSLQSNLSDLDLYSMYLLLLSWVNRVHAVSRHDHMELNGWLQGWFCWCNIPFLQQHDSFLLRVLWSHVAFALVSILFISGADLHVLHLHCTW